MSGSPPDPDLTHRWCDREGLDVYERCGVVRRADKKNLPCAGPLRAESRPEVRL